MADNNKTQTIQIGQYYIDQNDWKTEQRFKAKKEIEFQNQMVSFFEELKIKHKTNKNG